MRGCRFTLVLIVLFLLAAALLLMAVQNALPTELPYDGLCTVAAINSPASVAHVNDVPAATATPDPPTGNCHGGGHCSSIAGINSPASVAHVNDVPAATATPDPPTGNCHGGGHC